MSSLDDHYQILDASPSSSLEEIRVIYRDLAQVWHPDRFQKNPRLREKAEAKLKTINQAYEAIQASLESPTKPGPSAVRAETRSKKKKTPTPTSGINIPEHEADALGWYAKAAVDGHADSQCIIATMYAEGQLVPRDEAKATHWFKLSAGQGHPAAEFQMGLRYYSGGGEVEKDPQKAFNFYRRAALQGHAKAQFNLGIMYTNGVHVQRDDTSAYAWFTLADEGGHPGSLAIRDSIGAGMDQAEFERATRQTTKLRQLITEA